MARLAAYYFNEPSGNLILDHQGNNDLVISGGTVTRGLSQGIRFGPLAKSSSVAVGTLIANAIKASGEVTVELFVSSTNTTQSGPARLVELLANSSLPEAHIFLVGPQVDRYHARIRRNAADKWGISTVVMSTPNSVVQDSSIQHIVFRQRVSGDGEFFINGVSQGVVNVGSLDSSSWVAASELFVGNNRQGDRRFEGFFFKLAIYDHFATNLEIGNLFSAGHQAPATSVVITPPIDITVPASDPSNTLSSQSAVIANWLNSASSTGAGAILNNAPNTLSLGTTLITFTSTGASPVIASVTVTVYQVGSSTWNASAIQPAVDKRFFQWHETPIYLLGASDDDNISNWSTTNQNQHLDLMKSLGGNYIRCVLNTHLSDIPVTGQKGQESDGYTLQPFVKITSGPNIGKYDLTQFNQVYFDRLDLFLAACKSRNIIVQLTLWELWDFIHTGPLVYHENAWNPANNINYTAAQSGLPLTNTSVAPWSAAFVPLVRFGHTTPTLDNRIIVLTLQEAFVTKVMETCLLHNNVLYNIVNERFYQRTPRAFADYWITFIKSLAGAESKTIQVTDMIDPYTFAAHATSIARTNLDYYEVSQMSRSGGQLQYDSMLSTRVALTAAKPMTAVKVYSLYDTPSAIGPNEPIDKLFKTMFAGVAAVRLHRPTNKPTNAGPYKTSGFGLSYVSNGVFLGRQILKSARMFASAIDMVKAYPDPNFVTSGKVDNEAYVVRTTNKLAVYFTGVGDASVSLGMQWLPTDTYIIRRLNVLEATWSTLPATVLGGAGASTHLLQGTPNVQTIFLVESGTLAGDTESPIVSVPNTLTVIPSNSVSIPASQVQITSWLNSASASDNVSVVSFVNTAPTSFAPGTSTPIVWIATDAAGNTGTGNSTIVIAAWAGGDVTGPVVTPRPPITVLPSSSSSVPATQIDIATWLLSTTAIDNVGVVQLIHDAPAFFSQGTTTVVTWTARDAAGNVTTATSSVTIGTWTGLPPVVIEGGTGDSSQICPVGQVDRVVNILSAVRETLSDGSQDRWTTQRLLKLVDAAQKSISLQANLLRGTTTVDLVSNQAFYCLPQDCRKLINVKDIKSCTLPFKSFQEMDSELNCGWSNTTGKPTTILYNAMSPRRFQVYPRPDIAAVSESPLPFKDNNDYLAIPFGSIAKVSFTTAFLSIRYYRNPVTVDKTSSVLEIPPEFDLAIQYYVTGMALRDNKDTESRQQASEELQFYTSELRQAIRHGSDNFLGVDPYSTNYTSGFNT